MLLVSYLWNRVQHQGVCRYVSILVEEIYMLSFYCKFRICKNLVWMEEPGRLQSVGSLRVRHDWATSLSLFTFMGEGSGNPLQCSCLENPRDGGACWAAVYEVAQSRTRLKWLSMHALEKEMATHFSILAWRIPGTEEPGGLPSMGSHRVGYDWSDLA